MAEIAIIADDLTGALDAAAPFAARGLRVVVATAPEHVATALATGAEVVAVASDTRDGPEAEARRIAAEVAAAVSAVPVVFKKVDSRLKGHVRAEAMAVAEVRGARAIVLCPAIPELGRVVVGGRVTGFGVEAPINAAAVVAGATPTIGVADARSDDDLDALAGRAIAEGALMVGARGLAAAVARRWGSARPRAAGRLAGPAAIAVGSRDPITLEQVRRLRAAWPEVAVASAPNGRASASAPAGSVVVLQATPGARETSARVQAAFAASFVPAFTSGRRTLVLTGGATASAVLARLGIGVLELLREAAPGIPVSHALGTAEPLEVVTKSGGFGGPDALADLVALIGRSMERTG